MMAHYQLDLPEEFVMLAALLLQGPCQPAGVLGGRLDHDQLLYLLASHLRQHMSYCLALLLEP